MGLLTFAQFQDEISENLAAKKPSPVRLKRFVNYAVQDLASRKQFDELFLTVPFNVFPNVTSYPIPADLLGIHAIVVDGTPLRLMERQWSEKDIEAEQPRYYKRREQQIIVFPKPDVVYSGGYIEYYKVPDQLVVVGDKSPFPSYWDQALVFLGTSHGWSALGEDDKATFWENKFSRFADRRMTDEDISADIQKEGLNVAWSYDDLVDNPPHVSGGTSTTSPKHHHHHG